MPERTPSLYLDDIRASIGKIETYVRGMSWEEFAADQKTIDAVVRNLEIIGEAANRLPEETRARYPGIPWDEMVGMRNKIIHEYFGVDLEILWETVQQDIPGLKEDMGSQT